MNVSLASRPSDQKTSANANSIAQSDWLDREFDLEEVLDRVTSAIAPLWPLQDYVAVNPYLGYMGKRFLEARQALREVRDTDLLMPMSYYRNAMRDDHLSEVDLEAAFEQCQLEYPEVYQDHPLEYFLAIVFDSTEQGRAFNTQAVATENDRQYRSVAECLDECLGTNWNETIVSEISRVCAAHYDEGQAAWQSPWQNQSLFTAWRAIAQIDRRLEWQGIQGIRHVAKQMPASPHDAILWCLDRLQVPTPAVEGFLLCLMYSVAGWSGYIKQRCNRAIPDPHGAEDLTAILAIRLVYDVALYEAHAQSLDIDCWPTPSLYETESKADTRHTTTETAARYLLQVAIEKAYRRGLIDALTQAPEHTSENTSKSLKKQTPRSQWVFCIDVRSEVMRRYLEWVDPECETFGFAGFFGIPLSFVPFGASQNVNQLPVLLRPSITITEQITHPDPAVCEAQTATHHRVQWTRKTWRKFQSSAVSCFSFVESLGWSYVWNLTCGALKKTVSSTRSQQAGLQLQHEHVLAPQWPVANDPLCGLTRQIEIAHTILKNLGLVGNFAKLVVFCGHACDTVNNPYRAGLDCGACGGHSGEVNARLAASLLNQPQVRSGLRERGIEIPDETWFIGAVHHTTRDEIAFLDCDQVPLSHRDDLERLRHVACEAGTLSGTERALRLDTSADNIKERSQDWSEVRPEWGLAGNAALIVARRERTKQLVLHGRTFLHSYEYEQDEELKVLELIMTAPLIVSHWINMQYFASTVDPENYGSGNKTLHNVVGQMGIIEGNSGDLKTGLPWQSIHDGTRYQHEPLRLTAVIEAPVSAIEYVVRRHPMLQEMMGNGWLTVISLDGQAVRDCGRQWIRSESTDF